MKIKSIIKVSSVAALSIMTTTVNASLWSDTSIGYRYGSQYREPFNPDDISKSIVNLQHVSGYKYGTNFFNVDFLFADDKDPISPGSDDGSQEAYVVYRHTLDLGAVMDKDLSMGGFIRGFGVTAGFDANMKDDAGYNSAKRMLVLGPTVMFDVPGFFNLSLVSLWESNAPYNKFTSTSTDRYTYDTHAALMGAWGIPFTIGSIPLSFEGFVNYIAPKGTSEFGGKTSSEFNFDGQIMYDASAWLGAKEKTFKVGVEYQYWNHKFGNTGFDGSGGETASTPMIRTEYHF